LFCGIPEDNIRTKVGFWRHLTNNEWIDDCLLLAGVLTSYTGFKAVLWSK
jgi:hypothetical protein